MATGTEALLAVQEDGVIQAGESWGSFLPPWSHGDGFGIVWVVSSALSVWESGADTGQTGKMCPLSTQITLWNSVDPVAPSMPCPECFLSPGDQQSLPWWWEMEPLMVMCVCLCQERDSLQLGTQALSAFMY